MRLLWLGLMLSVMAACGLPGDSRPYKDVGADATVLRDAFNSAADQVRLVLLVSPTCGTCLRGAQTVQADVLDALKGEDLRVFVVWLPKRGGESKHVSEATKTVPDRRASHYWDGDGSTMRQYDGLLKLGIDAWDMYMVYPVGTRWPEEAPSEPIYWSHQLGTKSNPAVHGPWLSGSELLRMTQDALMAGRQQ
jgi:hypothetical protein